MACLWGAFGCSPQHPTLDAKEWAAMAESRVVVGETIYPIRGNILSNDGQVLSASELTYNIYFDFKTVQVNEDTLRHYLPELCEELSKKFPDRTAESYRETIMTGFANKKGHVRIVGRKISTADYKEVKNFSFIRKGTGKSGFFSEKIPVRFKPFGRLASRTIGDIYLSYDKGGKNGIDLFCDSTLKGTDGSFVREVVRGKPRYVIMQQPIDGMDVQTTIDIPIQKITDQALESKLKDIDAVGGTAIVMEVKTGKVVAMTNLTRVETGSYAESFNYAVAYQSEPGSLFSTVSMAAVLEDGFFNPTDTIDTGCGMFNYANVYINDCNRNKGGFGMLSASQILAFSSNVGMAKLILRAYEQQPEKYVNCIRQMSFDAPMNIEIPGIGQVNMKHPTENADRWSKITLPWMSFGYEIQVPPIYTLRFYNAIANDGVMVNPYLVQSLLKEGKVVQSYPTQVVNSQICSPNTVAQLQTMLRDVVEEGSGAPANSSLVSIAGKTGTAQMSYEDSGFRSDENPQFQVSFCGYFPAEKPVYSCIVVIRNPQIGYPSGGSMAGSVVKTVAESLSLKTDSL